MGRKRISIVKKLLKDRQINRPNISREVYERLNEDKLYDTIKRISEKDMPAGLKSNKLVRRIYRRIKIERIFS